MRTVSETYSDQRWPNRVADLLCSLERKVGLSSSLTMSNFLTILCWGWKKWDQLCTLENTEYLPLDLPIYDTVVISEHEAKQNSNYTICVTPKFRTFDSCLDHNENLMVKNSASLQVLIWGLYQRWPNRVADLLCSLERKVGLPSSLMSETIKAKALGDVAHFIKSILSFTELKPRLNQVLG